MQGHEPIFIESFDAKRHDRSGFTCGVGKADNFLKLTSKKLSRSGHVRLFVATNDGASIAGFYALNAHSISYHELPPEFARDRPSSGWIPAAYIAMIAVAKAEQGKGIGRMLLVDALKRVADASRNVGMSITMLDILDDGDEKAIAARQRLYGSFGFRSFVANPLRMWVSTTDK
jgi:GNAT superfamily N-acetyltransferase